MENYLDIRFIRFDQRFQDAIIALHRAAIENLAVGIDPRVEEYDLNDIDGVYLIDGGEFLVGLQQDHVVAMGGYRRLSAEHAELKRMRVVTDLQGHGVGSRLLTELEARARLNGFRELRLETAKSRRPTLAFYLKHGYLVTGSSQYGAVETITFAKQIVAA